MYGDEYLPPTGGRILLRLAALAAVLTCIAAGAVAVIAGSFTSQSGTGGIVAAVALAASAENCAAPAQAQPGWQQWDTAQVTDAATIIRTGQAAHVPVYGQVIAVATAMQESGLVNLGHGDRDSLGVFQQRPSQGWGSAAQVMNPAYAAGQFYIALLQVPGWQQLPLDTAAQDVQRSGTPGAYAKWQSAAAALVAHVTGSSSATAAASGPVAAGCGQAQVPAATPATARAVISWAAAQLGTLYQYGGSCTDAHSTTDPMRRCDCSSLIQQAEAHGAGIMLPRTSQAQWAALPHITASLAQPGDLVFFAGSDGTAAAPGHVGLVVDPGQHLMIDAYVTGDPVAYDTYGLPGSRGGLTVVTGYARPVATSSGSTS